MDGTMQEIYDALVKKHGEKMKNVVESSLELRRSIGEQILSSDLETIVAANGEVYSADTMEDAYDTGEASKGSGTAENRVLCTTAHGLRRLEKREGGGDDEPRWQSTVLLKPKVALTSLVGELQLELIEVDMKANVPIGQDTEVSNAAFSSAGRQG